jgi:hypothetical protein
LVLRRWERKGRGRRERKRRRGRRRGRKRNSPLRGRALTIQRTHQLLYFLLVCRWEAAEVFELRLAEALA